MDRPHVRPRVALRFPHPPEVLQGILTARLGESPRLEGRVRRQAVLVWMGPTHRRWWSPCLDLTATPEANGTRLSGYYTAQPQFMTLCIFASILLSFLALVSATWSLVQLQMGEPPACALGTLAAVTGLLAVFGLNRLGQRWAASQMHELAVVLHDPAAVEVDEARAFGP